MKSLTHEQLMQLTLLPTVDGNIVGTVMPPNAIPTPQDLIPVGIVRPDFGNLLAASARMYGILYQTIQAHEATLQIMEAEGLDKSAYHLTQLISCMKLIQKSAIDGPDVLTGFKPTVR